MKLDKKKKLAAKTFNIGLSRIIFDSSRLDEIKEAITKQDIRDLKESGVIKIKETSGRRKKRKRKKGKAGKIKKKISKRKQNYVKLTRKLRKYIKELKRQNKLNIEKYLQLRKQINAKIFKNKKQLQEFIKQI